jgi:hypothetical protein
MTAAGLPGWLIGTKESVLVEVLQHRFAAFLLVHEAVDIQQFEG